MSCFLFFFFFFKVAEVNWGQTVPALVFDVNGQND